MIDRKVSKILLIVPPVIITKNRSNFNLNLPMGVAYIAAVLEEASYDVVVLDAVAEKMQQTTPVAGSSEVVRIGMTDNEIRQYINNNPIAWESDKYYI